MAKLKLRLTNLDDAPEGLRDYYRELDDGTFMIDHEADPEGYGIDNLPAIRGKLDEALRKKKSTEAKLVAREDGSLYTREEIEALEKESRESAQLIATLKDKDKSVEEKFAERIRSETKPLHEKIKQRDQQIAVYRDKVLSAEKQKVVDSVLKSIGKPIDVFEEGIRDAIGREILVTENEEGQVVSQVIDLKSGKPRYSSLTGHDGYMSIEEYAKSKDLTERFSPYLEGDGKEGAGKIGGPNPPPRRAGSSRDVVIPSGSDQSAFEAAYAKAREQGGEVVIQGGGDQ